MPKPRLHLFVLLAAFSAALGSSHALAGDEPYKLAQSVHIGGEGSWDYVTLSADGSRLYVPRTTHTQVLDTATWKVVADIPGTKRSHGVALVPSVARGFVSDGTDASVQIFDLKTNEVLGTIKAQPDADGIIYDAFSNHVFVVSGDNGVLIPIKPDVDPKSGSAEAAIDLGGKPEFLVSDNKGKLYINLADKAQMAVVDTQTMKVIDHWPTAPGTDPTGLSMDREKGHLFVGCRNQKLLIMNAADGKILGDLPIGVRVDATVVDKPYALASCADGTLSVASETSPGKYEVVQVVKTAAGARTMAVDNATGRIYLPAADMTPADPANPKARPKAVPGSFKIIVVERAK
ncbi:MAG TPA: hypothetical protein VLI90_08805 [Tepidisphaeraceae bacterium]|nr:hypothetical protein [Tepidisphaeraceae bacterium]